MLRYLRIPQADPNPIPLAGSPWPIILILMAYLLFVLKLGKVFMRNRKPYDLRTVLRVYNIFQVLYNGVYFGMVFYYVFLKAVCNIHCIESFPQDHEYKQPERLLHTAYLLNKVLDLMDTVFFVLRKSYKQITFLHIYHHVFMSLGSYLLTRYYGTGGHFIAVGLLNSLVHTIMYFYYFISAEYPQLRHNIWWKKYLTLTQISQFFVLMSYAFYVRFLSPNCGVPHGILHLNMLQGAGFIYMFGKFYVRNYLSPAKAKPS
ncbi:elongation of very long chain fatty acids protein F [Drosophila eugracilis]|uniref:elongation of very long chain fatty acids protein F n=1 Tax=Drosophila eugracilis TaxID=29029 RepID=UPI0007E5ED1E|nr:elongation of very long chain fatty acids protein F [Drosophila eugracilis]